MSQDADHGGDDAAAPDGDAADDHGTSLGQPRRKRRRRRPKVRDSAPGETTDASTPRGSSATLSVLTAGLFSHLDDREIPCKVDGCENTWTWSAEEQIRGFGQPPPKRMCSDHLARFHALEDRDVPCANPGCEKTWHFSKSAQLALLEKTGSAELPARMCDDCRRAERELGDAEVPCRIEGCRRTWRWTRDAQLKHRAWLRRQAGEGPSPEPDGQDSEDKGKRRRRRKRRRAAAEGPPRRLCGVCKDKLDKLIDREVVCKVHGCTRTVIVDRESQLRAWVALDSPDLEAEAPLPKRMCDVCREFCRLHDDREVPCGRPGCDRTWTYKTGAQLQAFLAGRLEDPIRLCDECSKRVPVGTPAVEVEPGVELMPCVVPGCDGIWLFKPGMSIAPAEDGDLPSDRMCDTCRAGRGEEPRQTGVSRGHPTPADPAPDPSGDATGAIPGVSADSGAQEAAAVRKPDPIEAPVDAGMGSEGGADNDPCERRPEAIDETIESDQAPT